MEKLLPDMTVTLPYYNGLNVNTPKLTPSWTSVLDSEHVEKIVDLHSFKRKCSLLSIEVSLHDTKDYKRSLSDLDAVLVKESDIEHVTNVHLRIGGFDIVSLSKNMINDFCDKTVVFNETNDETYINLFSKFIDKIPVKSCYYHTVMICFEYSKQSIEVSTETKKVFIYNDSDSDYESDDDSCYDIHNDPNSYRDVTTIVYHGYTPNIKLFPSTTPCGDMISFINKVNNITEPYNLGLSRYMFFEALCETPKDIDITVDNKSFTIPNSDLFYLENTKQFMWQVPHNVDNGFVRVQGNTLTTSTPIVYSFHANTLRIQEGLAGAMFAY